MPLILCYIFLCLSLIYSIATLLVIAGNRKKYKIIYRVPSVSIVLAARNEEAVIEKCLKTLKIQNYPKEKLEIIVIDDRSEDKTCKVASDFIKGKPQFKLILISDPPQGLTGKANALKIGIENSRGEIILSTDADCEVPPNWVSSMVSYFSDDVGLVAGFSTPPTKGWFASLQALDHLFLISVASGFAGLGIAQSCIGNNIAFRRNAYDAVGGYDGVGFTVTEDAGLLRAIVKKTNYQISFNLTKPSLVTTRAARNLKELTSQRMRWLNGGIQAGRLMLICLGLTFALVLLTASTLVSWTVHGLEIYSAIAAVILMGANLSIIMVNHRFIGISRILRWFIPHQLFFLLYTLYFGVLYIMKRNEIQWKGRAY